MPETERTAPKDPSGGMKLAGEVIVQTFSRGHGLPHVIVQALRGVRADRHERPDRPAVRRVRALGAPAHDRRSGRHHARLLLTSRTSPRGWSRRCSRRSVDHETFNITAGEGRTLREVYDLLQEHYPDMPVSVADKKDDFRPKRGALDVAKARELLGFEPEYPLERGLAEYVDFLESLPSEGPLVACARSARPPALRSSPISRSTVSSRRSASRCSRSFWRCSAPAGCSRGRGSPPSRTSSRGARAAATPSRSTRARTRSTSRSRRSGSAPATRCSFPTSRSRRPRRRCSAPARRRSTSTSATTTSSTSPTPEELLSPRVKALVFVDLFGKMGDAGALERFASEHGLLLVEDAAQTLGGVRDGRPAGSVGAVSCFSFDPTKVVSAPGSGGALLTDDDELAAAARGAQPPRQDGFRRSSTSSARTRRCRRSSPPCSR